ncbi:MAG: squalene synthase HpnC [Bacteroidota bacterium]
MYQKPCVLTTQFQFSEFFDLDKAYSEAEEFAKSHYENFPVISLFISKSLRKHIAVIYQFARQADDIVDEGIANTTRLTHSDSECELRMQNLELYYQQLTDSLNEKFASPFWAALYNTIKQFNLTTKNFHDLLDAFRQDIVKNCYETFEELLHYCERSANPVGRIVLELHNIRDQESIDYSDAICTALQLTNFYQDVSLDYPNKNRIYIPATEIRNFSVTENIFQLKENSINFQQLLKYQVERTKQLFINGRRLLPRLPYRLRFQIRITILGGEEILKKISYINYNVLSIRPTLTRIDILKLFFKALLNL